MRKANMADRYKQKLEAIQGVEKEAEELRARLEDSRLDVQTMEAEADGLARSIESYRGMLETVEKQNYELQMVKKQLEIDNNTLSQRLDNTREQNFHNAELISSLQDRISELEARAPDNDEMADLESLLQSGDDANDDL